MPVVPETKATWTNNLDALSSTNLHAYLRDPIKFLMNPPRARLRQTVAQSLTNNTSTVITFNSELFDTDIDGVGGHSTSVNTSRFTARYPGLYQVSGGCSFASNGTGFRMVSWAVNGTIHSGTDALLGAVSGNTTRQPARTELIPLDIGDYLEMRVYQSSGGALNTAVTNDEQPTMNILWKGLL